MIDFNTFILAGNATFTITSKRTGARFTFKVRQPKEDAPHFVSLLSGPNNDEDYNFLGTIFSSGEFHHGRKSRITPDAPSAKAFAWLWRHRDNLPADKVEVHHCGRCCRCGRTLTVPESIESGIGPECASKIGE